MAKDPVCGMEVDKKTAIHKTVHTEKTHYFCYGLCKTKFEANPYQIHEDVET